MATKGPKYPVEGCDKRLGSPDFQDFYNHLKNSHGDYQSQHHKGYWERAWQEAVDYWRRGKKVLE